MSAAARLTALVVIFLGLGGAACAPNLPMVTPADAARTGTPFETLSQGRDAYVANCGGCHRLRRPGRHTAPEWRELMVDMAVEAELTPAENLLIMAYVNAFAAPGAQPDAQPNPP